MDTCPDVINPAVKEGIVMREDRFTDKVVIITGGGTGIGKICALAFAAEDAQVIIAGRRRIATSANKGAVLRTHQRYKKFYDHIIEVVKGKYGQAFLVQNTGFPSGTGICARLPTAAGPLL